MTILAGFIIFFVVLYQKKVIIQRNEVEAIKAEHQRELLERTIEVEEVERESLAKNIHDDLGALISILRLNNSRTIKNIGNEDILIEIHNSNSTILNKTSESLRSISKKLASPTLLKLGYISALHELCQYFNQTGEMRMALENKISVDLTLSPQNTSHLFRASQEIINNIVKHANATEINVNLKSVDNTILISFKHNGLGISNKNVDQLIKENKGLGLTSIQSRLSIINANIDFLAPTDSNACIIITYPNNDET